MSAVTEGMSTAAERSGRSQRLESSRGAGSVIPPARSAALSAAEQQTKPSVDEQFVDKIPVAVGNGVKVPLIILATIATLAAFDYAESVVMPVILAFVISLTLTPINMWLQKRLAPSLSAMLLVAAVTGLVGIATLTLSQPVMTWVADAPRIGAQLKVKLAELQAPLRRLTRVGEEVDRMTTQTADPTVQEVVVRQPGLMNKAATNVSAIASTLVIAIALTYFLLATNRLIYEKIIFMAPRLSDKKRALTTLNTIVTSVAKYLLTITTINVCFGLIVGGAMALLGMPNPVLWGVGAFLFKYLPFVGSIVGTVAAVAVGLLIYDDLTWAFVPGLVYFTLSTIEGNFITPTIVGHRLELNPVAILLSIAVWGFLWGIVGVILAVPILIILKVMCDNITSLSAIGQFLSGATALEQVKEEVEEGPVV